MTFSLRRMCLQFVLSIELFGLCGCRPKSSQSDRKPASDVLVVVDLSSSLSPQEKDRIPGIVNGILSKLEPGSHFAVYELETFMGNRKSLLEDDIADSKFMSDQVDEDGRSDGWKPELIKTLGEARSAKTSSLTSCYLASMSFADEYFARRVTQGGLLVKEVYWVGDLIEDCPDVRYNGLRLPNIAKGRGLDFSTVPIGGLQASLHTLAEARLYGVIIPRGLQDKDTNPPAWAIRSYWHVIPPKMFAPPKDVIVGTTQELGIRED